MKKEGVGRKLGRMEEEGLKEGRNFLDVRMVGWKDGRKDGWVDNGRVEGRR
jgi:hypothetical protein